VSHIHFIGGEKGGVGKSVLARLLAQRFIDRSIPFAAVDADVSHGALLRSYSGYAHAVDLSLVESADQIFDRALGAERQVLVDLPAQSFRSLTAWMDGSSFLALAKEMSIGITFWHVSDGGFASVSEIEKALATFGDSAQHVVVKNFGRSRDFEQFEASPVAGRLGALSGKVMELPELESGAMYKMDRFGLSYWAAAHAEDGERSLKPLERARVKAWLARCYAQLDALNGAV
jgi:hypothetical protein